MHAREIRRIAVHALLVWLGLAIPALVGSAHAQLANTDCAKCHAGPPADIAAKGGKHKTSVGCQDCHQGHRPTSKVNIPKCDQCHSGKPHFGLANCLGCHKNPHQPKVITFAGQLTEPCLTCHTAQNEQLKSFKSKHSSKACTFCHNEHGKIPECVGCHNKLHSATLTQADCKKCHKAHKPKVVAYVSDTPSAMCGACHKIQFAQLEASATKHHALNCATCHQDKHPTMPKCQDCHDVPHPAGIMAKFPKCTDCHKNPHDLNNWTAALTKK